MRIAVVTGFPPDPYGEAHYAGQVFQSLAKQFPDIDILICSHKNSSVPEQEQVLPNLYVRRITRPDSRVRATIALFPLLYYLLLFQPDIVHFQGTHTPRYGGIFGEPIIVLIGILRLLGIRVFFTAHSIWLPSELMDLWKHKNIPWFLRKLLTSLYGADLRMVARWSDLLSFAVAGEISPLVKNYQEVYHLTSSKIAAEIHPCTGVPVLSEQQTQAKKSLGLSGYRVVSAVGFVRPDKGYHLLLDCANELLNKFSDVVIIIVGMPQGVEGQRYAETLEQRLVGISHKDRVLLRLKYLSDDDFSIYVEATDVVVVPYPQVMGPSGPVHHALGRGKTVIASATGHNLGLSGVCKLFLSGDASALGRALDELLSDPQQMAMYAERGKDYASRHTWDDLSRQYVTQYGALKTSSQKSQR